MSFNDLIKYIERVRFSEKLSWISKNLTWAYIVPGPNSLWHNYGLHKLIHWSIIIYGFIDSFSV